MVERFIESTDGLPAHQRWDSWRETIRVPADAVPPAGAQAFSATRSIAAVGGATLIDTTSQPLSFSRSARDIARAGPDHACVSVWLEGGLGCEPFNRAQVDLVAGEMTVLDLGRPYRVATRGRYRELRLLVPRDVFAARIGRLETLSGLKVERGNGLGALASGYVASLFAALPTLSDEAAALGLDAAVHLLSNLFNAAPSTGGGSGAPPSDDVVLVLAERHIQARMADPGLDAAGAARAVGVSRSRLYTAFEGRGGVASAIREARLRRAADLLRAEAHRHRSIEDVARLCGFADYGTFARGFRRHFGTTPRGWRGGDGP